MSSAWLSTIHSSAASSRRCSASHSSSGVGTQPGFQKSVSRWRTRTPSREPSSAASRDLPAPAGPVTTIRLTLVLLYRECVRLGTRRLRAGEPCRRGGESAVGGGNRVADEARRRAAGGRRGAGRARVGSVLHV